MIEHIYAKHRVSVPLSVGAHQRYVLRNIFNIYEYDSADDGPEVEAITRILATHSYSESEAA